MVLSFTVFIGWLGVPKHALGRIPLGFGIVVEDKTFRAFHVFNINAGSM